jgi:Ca2+-binding RTX toxin-like protein
MEPASGGFLTLVLVRLTTGAWCAIGGTAIAIALVPGTAGAATVSAAPDGTVTFSAVAGELNKVQYERSADQYILSDSGAPLTAGVGCTNEGGRVRCGGSTLVVNAGDGDDTVGPYGFGSNIGETVYGEDGNDTLTGNVYGGPGNDTLTPGEGLDVADGGPGQDTLIPGYSSGALYGGDGNDHLTAAYATRITDGGADDDLLETEGPAPLTGGPGDDRLVRTRSSDCMDCSYGVGLLDGGDGDDTLEGSEGDEFMSGGPGEDTLHGAGGHDLLNGGEANDFVDVGGPKVVRPGLDQPPEGFVPPYLRPQPMSIVDGGPGDDRLEGGPNQDELHGGDGNDALHGGDDNDTLDGGAGADLLEGGPGKADRVDFTGRPEPVAIDLTSPGGDGAPGENDSYQPDIELFILSDGNDRFTAGPPEVTVYGGLGNDVIAGSPGADLLKGDVLQGPFGDRPGGHYGDDSIDGRGGNDDIDGDAGNDVLRGGLGDDRLDGGRPVINYMGTSTRYPSFDTIYGGPGNDSIRRGGRVSAGPGDDEIDVASFYGTNRSPLIALGHGGSVRCGSGGDLAKGDYYDEIGLDCEAIWEGTSPWRTVRVRSDGTVTLKARCAWDYSAPCRGRARLVPSPKVVVRAISPLPILPQGEAPRPARCHGAHDPRSLGVGRFNLRAGRVNRVAIRVGGRARRSLDRFGCLLLRVAFRFSEPGRRQHEMTRTLALRAPR